MTKLDTLGSVFASADEPAPGTPTILAQSQPTPAPAEAPRAFRTWFFALLVVVVVAISVQNLWLRRRAENEAARQESDPDRDA